MYTILVLSCFPGDNESFLPLRVVCVIDFVRDPEIILHDPLCFFLLSGRSQKKKRKDLSSEQSKVWCSKAISIALHLSHRHQTTHHRERPMPQSESPRPQSLKLPSPPPCAVVSDSIAPHSVSLESGQISDSSIMKWVFFQTRCYFSVSLSLLLARTQYGRRTVLLPEFGDSPLTIPGDKAQKGWRQHVVAENMGSKY